MKEKKRQTQNGVSQLRRRKIVSDKKKWFAEKNIERGWGGEEKTKVKGKK